MCVKSLSHIPTGIKKIHKKVVNITKNSIDLIEPAIGKHILIRYYI